MSAEEDTVLIILVNSALLRSIATNVANNALLARLSPNEPAFRVPIATASTTTMVAI